LYDGPDVDDILELSRGIYNGTDYVPHVLKSWIEEEENDPKGRRRNMSLKVRLFSSYLKSLN
jgi:hypothetical protein